MTILYADDDPEEIGFFCQALKAVDDSIVCITAPNGEEALLILQRIEPPAFIFLDLNMPIMNGRECLTEIKKISTLKDIPVIVYSSLATRRDIRDLIDLGAFRFLNKQFDITGLCIELYAILKTQNKPAA